MLSPENARLLKRLLVKHEGKENYPYTDTVGKITIGIGYNLTDRGLPDSWINTQYDADVTYFYDHLSVTFPWFNDLSPVRQIVLIDMAFMGLKTLHTFTHFLDALSRADYHLAGEEMLRSLWAKQVGQRAQELATMMITDSLAGMNDNGMA